MKNLSRAIAVLLTVTILALANVQGVATAATAKAKVFTDVKAGAWYKQYVDDISSKGIIDGYGNGKFGPNDKLTVDQLLTMMVKANNITITHKSTDIYWGCPYIRAAKEKGWVVDGEFTTYKTPIKRGEIARIIARAMPTSETPIALTEYQNMIKDYNDIEPSMREYILKVRAAGIIEGYYDEKYDSDKYSTGSNDEYKGMVFGSSKNATRAEASTMIVKYIAPVKRTIPSVVVGEKQGYYNGFTTGVEGVNTILNRIGGTIESENKNKDYDILWFRVRMWKDYAYQPELAAQGYKEARDVLIQKLDAKTVDAAIDYAKTKIDCDTRLETKNFVSVDNKYVLMVQSITWQDDYINFAVSYSK